MDSLLYSDRRRARVAVMEATVSRINGEVIGQKITGSVAENARELGISRQHLHNIIKGRKTPSAELLLKIQEMFDVPAGSLIKTT